MSSTDTAPLTDLTDLIPCEVCDQMVGFEDYEAHILRCTNSHLQSSHVLSAFFSFLSSVIVLEDQRQESHASLFLSFAFGSDELSDEQQQAINQMISETLGTVQVGIDDIDSVSTIIDPVGGGDTSDECPICQYCPTGSVRKLNKCNHCFCGECIEKWLSISKKCPLCMTYLEEEEEPARVI